MEMPITHRVIPAGSKGRYAVDRYFFGNCQTNHVFLKNQ